MSVRAYKYVIDCDNPSHPTDQHLGSLLVSANSAGLALDAAKRAGWKRRQLREAGRVARTLDLCPRCSSKKPANVDAG